MDLISAEAALTIGPLGKQLTHNAPPRPEDCLTTVGWMGKAIECSGGRQVQVLEKLCRNRGAAHCEFHCAWV